MVVVQRQHTELNFKAILGLKELGLKVVYDTDDNLWAVQSDNPHAKMFAEEKDAFVQCAMLCNAITVSTQGLRTGVKTAIPRFQGEILICPNGMNFNYFRPPSVERDPERIVIGWAGSNTHSHDVKDAWSVLPAIMEEFPNVHMEFIGQAPPAKLWGHPRVKLRRFVPVGEFATRFSSWAWDVTLAPLMDNRFNRSKSNIKMLEAAALGIPILVSYVQPYDEFCALDTHLRWLLCSKEIQWKNKLRSLIADAALRKFYAERVRSVAETWFNIEKLKDNWVHALQTAHQC